MNKKEHIIVFIVEGESREVSYIDSLCKIFLNGKNKIEYISLPAKDNIYSLYSEINNYGNDTDIIKFLSLKDETINNKIQERIIDQIYLFFDYDPHQRNLPKGIDRDGVIEEMLQYFNNETENGKLYINYPMVESTRDYMRKTCKPFTNNCVTDINIGENYKSISGKDNKNSNIKHANFNDWKNIIEVYFSRVKCLFQIEDMDVSNHKKLVTPFEIFKKQKRFIEKEKIFILSSLPEFIIDYKKQNDMKAILKEKNIKPYPTCKPGDSPRFEKNRNK